jgi:hypothetical protein
MTACEGTMLLQSLSTARNACPPPAVREYYELCLSG